MNELKSLTLNGKTYDGFTDPLAREALEQKQPKGAYVKTVNGEPPDESGNVKITIPDSAEGAVLYTEQELTEEQKVQARKNIGAISKEEAEQIITPGALSAEQINALDALFKVVAYTEDVSERYHDFCVAFGIVSPDDTDAVVVKDIKMGVVGFDSGWMTLNTQERFATRATAIPIGMYLKNGKTYKFSIGALGSLYKFGVKVYVAPAPGMEFPYTANGEVIGYDVREMIFASDWITTECDYTVERDNCILAVNFALVSGGNLTETDYAEILANFVIDEI